MTENTLPERTQFFHPLLPARDYQERVELSRLCKWWQNSGAVDGGVVSLAGLGGSGKTAIVDRFLRLLPGVTAKHAGLEKDESLPVPKNVFVYSFYREADASVFLEHLHLWLQQGCEQEAWQKTIYERIAHYFAVIRSLLLVLDGLEVAQESDGTGEIVELQLRQLPSRIADGYCPGISVVISTRFSFRSLARHACYAELLVDELSESAAVSLLERCGVTKGLPARRERLVREYRCHALSIDLIGHYVAEYYDGDIDKLPPETFVASKTDDPPSPKTFAIENDADELRRQETAEKERKLASITARYYQTLFNHDPAALAVLQRLCFFREGVDASLFSSIFLGPDKRHISGEHLARLTSSELEERLALLHRLRLIEFVESRQSRRFLIHPAVRNGFRSQMDEDTVQRGTVAITQNLTASLGGLPEKDSNPSEIGTIRTLQEILRLTLSAGGPNEAFGIYQDRMGGYGNLGMRLGQYQRGLQICREIRNSPGLSETSTARLVCSNDETLYSLALGELHPATTRFNELASDTAAASESDFRSSCVRNLIESCTRAGRLKEALELASREVARNGSQVERIKSFALRAHIQLRLGRIDDALDDFTTTQQLLPRLEEGKVLYGLMGVRYAALLASHARLDDAKDVIDKNRQFLIRRFGPDHQDLVDCDLALAQIAIQERDFELSQSLLTSARAWAITRDAADPHCSSLVIQAKLLLREVEDRSSIQSDSEAAETIEEGLRLIRKYGFSIYHIDLLLYRARLHLLKGCVSEALDDVHIALDVGIPADAITGQPQLLAARAPECGYAWAIPAGLQLRAEALLLQAAQQLGSDSFVPAKMNELPDGVAKLIDKAQTHLHDALSRTAYRWRANALSVHTEYQRR